MYEAFMESSEGWGVLKTKLQWGPGMFKTQNSTMVSLNNAPVSLQVKSGKFS